MGKALKRERKVEHTKQDQQKQQQQRRQEQEQHEEKQVNQEEHEQQQQQQQMQKEQRLGTSVPALLQALCEMGFGNAELNAELLEAHGEDLQRVLEVLAGGAGWQVF